MTDLEIAKTLKDAAQYIRDHGWTRGMRGDGGPRCALGSIASVLGLDGEAVTGDDLYHALERTPAVVALARALPAPHRDYLEPELATTQVYAYNDTVCGGTDEVLDLFESVALQHELRALAVTTLSQEAATAVCDNTVPEAVNA